MALWPDIYPNLSVNSNLFNFDYRDPHEKAFRTAGSGCFLSSAVTCSPLGVKKICGSGIGRRILR
jgi:hypothetical protein